MGMRWKNVKICRQWLILWHISELGKSVIVNREMSHVECAELAKVFFMNVDRLIPFPFFSSQVMKCHKLISSRYFTFRKSKQSI